MKNYFVKNRILENVERYLNQEKQILSESAMLDGFHKLQKLIEAENLRSIINYETQKLQFAK